VRWGQQPGSIHVINLSHRPEAPLQVPRVRDRPKCLVQLGYTAVLDASNGFVARCVRF
jgi:hypothetical protein